MKEGQSVEWFPFGPYQQGTIVKFVTGKNGHKLAIVRQGTRIVRKRVNSLRSVSQ